MDEYEKTRDRIVDLLSEKDRHNKGNELKLHLKQIALGSIIANMHPYDVVMVFDGIRVELETMEWTRKDKEIILDRVNWLINGKKRYRKKSFK